MITEQLSDASLFTAVMSTGDNAEDRRRSEQLSDASLFTAVMSTGDVQSLAADYCI
jgi:hypothetical protein